MLTDSLATFFLPAYLRADKTHPRYTEFYVVANACVLGLGLLLVGAGVMLYVHQSPRGFGLNALLGLSILGSMRWFGHYRLPMALTAAGSLLIIYDCVRTTGMLFSVNINLLYLYLVMALLADKRWGGLSVFYCLGLLVFVYWRTPAAAGLPANPLYVLCLHGFILSFLGGTMAYGQYTEEQSRRKIQALQNQRISLLDEAVRQRTEQLQTMRQAVAADFHDETGNVLAAITRQAALLEWQLLGQPEVLPVVRAILDSSNQLYAASKDLLWDLHQQSDHPDVLFHYLTAYGQQYYNQFDIAFSAERSPSLAEPGQLAPLAARNLLYIFKEAMGNVIKHAGATEVTLRLTQTGEQVSYALQDNGCWREPGAGETHYGLPNMRRRCHQQGFQFELFPSATGTRIEVTAPVQAAFIC